MAIHKEQWSSRTSFILAATGAAVGLGNIWKFPYMVGDNGGSAFVIVYLLAVVAVGLPLLMAEIILGKCGRANAIDTMQILARQNHASRSWRLVGWWGSIGLLLILAFYSVVSGWALAYLRLALHNAFAQQTPAAIVQIWQTFLQNPWQLLLWHSCFMLMTIGVVMLGVKRGLERANNVLMPLLLVILVILAVYSLTVGAGKQAAYFLLHLDFSKINARVAIDALGHAFFTLALGAGCMLVYGSYLPMQIKVATAVYVIAALDLLVAFLSGFAIFPLVFANGLQPEAGPGLMFKVLPMVFSSMPGGQILASLFFLLLIFAAWTSSISLVEPLVIVLIEKYKMTRKWSCLLIGVAAWLLGIIALLSFNVWSEVKLFGRWDFFTVMTDLATNIILPIGGLMFAIFAGWKLAVVQSKTALGFTSNTAFKIWQICIKYVAPFAIVLIMVVNFF